MHLRIIEKNQLEITTMINDCEKTDIIQYTFNKDFLQISLL
jgi:hypothetical protein